MNIKELFCKDSLEVADISNFCNILIKKNKKERLEYFLDLIKGQLTLEEKMFCYSNLIYNFTLDVRNKLFDRDFASIVADAIHNIPMQLTIPKRVEVDEFDKDIWYDIIIGSYGIETFYYCIRNFVEGLWKYYITNRGE